jgi:uncharacterized membrane protein
MMMILISGLIGLAMLGAFLGIMLWWVKAPPLIVIVVAVLAMAIYDLFMTVRYGEDYALRRRKRLPGDQPSPRR